MLKFISILIVSLSLLLTSACGADKKEEPKETSKAPVTDTQKEDVKTETDDVKVEKEDTKTEKPADADEKLYKNKINFTIEMENGGVMKGELYPDLAPKTVDNFVKLCKKNYYDGLIFHRVIEDFMIQGGGFDDDMNSSKETATIVGEFDSNGHKNPLKHAKGVISMARTMDPNSASSQFFIIHKDSPHLDGDYAAFGRITEGLDIIDEIATTDCENKEIFMGNQSVMMGDVPVKPQVIKTININ